MTGTRWIRVPACLAQEDGATMVEFAVAAVVLFLAILAIMEAGLALYAHHMISEAAREGTRYAMVRGNTCVTAGVSCTATTTQIQNFVKGMDYPGIDPANMTVNTTYSAYPAGGACSPNANCANPGNLVTVTVSYSFAVDLPFVPSNLLSMSSSSAMVISQ